MKAFRSVAALCALSAAMSSASAQTAETAADFRCAVISVKNGSQLDQAWPGGSVIMLMYYLGRIEGREPTLDAIERLKIEANAALDWTEEFGNSEAKRCGDALVTMGARLQDKKIESREPTPNP